MVSSQIILFLPPGTIFTFQCLQLECNPRAKQKCDEFTHLLSQRQIYLYFIILNGTLSIDNYLVRNKDT
jgi:hypothetical protein